MFVTVCSDDRVWSVVEWLTHGDEFVHFGMAALVTDQVTVNILEGLGIGETEMIRGDANHRSIFFMKPVCPERLVALDVLDSPGDGRSAL